jgi:DNA-binding NtrC family response regulator
MSSTQSFARLSRILIGTSNLRPRERQSLLPIREDRRMVTTLSSSNASRRFLIVEPDPLFRLLLCVALSGQFSDFHAVASFGEAQALLATQNFTAIIAERHLPGGSALNLYEQARHAAPEVPFVLMRGGEPIVLDDAHFRFFAKPFGLTEFTDCLAGMLSARSRT